MENGLNIKEELRAILRYYDKRLDSCTIQEMMAASRMLIENMEIYGSIEDFAKFYNVPEVNVRATINRKLIDKPIRKVLYPFHKFLKVAPEKWRRK